MVLAEAVSTTCYLVKQSPTTTLCCKIIEDIEELWFDKFVNYSFLHTFGCDAYVWIPKEKTKFDERFKLCIFISYPSGTNGYKLWDTTAHMIIII